MAAPSGPPGPPPPGAPPPTYGGGSGASGGGPRRTWRWVIAAVVGVLVLVGGVITVVLVAGDDDGDDKAGDSSSESSRADDPSSTLGTDPSTDSTDATADPSASGAVAPETDCDDKFPTDSAMAELAAGHVITVGVRKDQPGLSAVVPPATTPSGFEIAIVKQLIADLCIDPQTTAVTWQEVTPDQREPMLQTGDVDLLIGSYSITDERRTIVGQAGPYLETGQQLLVRDDSTVTSLADLQGKRVCGIEGSTSAQVITSSGAVLDPASSYAECVERVATGDAEATSTDGAILLRLARQTSGLKVVGPRLSEERYGVGYSPQEPEMCAWINGVLEQAVADGTWAEAFEENLGGSGVTSPPAPTVDACR